MTDNQMKNHLMGFAEFVIDLYLDKYLKSLKYPPQEQMPQDNSYNSPQPPPPQPPPSYSSKKSYSKNGQRKKRVMRSFILPQAHIPHETEKAILCSVSSGKFWLPKKMVTDAGSGNVKIKLPEDWALKLQKTKNGPEIPMTVDELIKQHYLQEVTND